MKIKFNEEICCEYCGEVIHVHISKCPKCGEHDTASSIYNNLNEAWGESEIPEFSCESCEASFKATKTLKEIREAEGIHDTEWNIV